ncbi:MAG: RNA polymerase sigma factor [Anaerolineales bacterium]|nr:RNA polymerase sigma factor [Anaerolineales bacterium]
MSDSESRDLILDLQNNSLNALGELYDRHEKMVYRTALGITGDPNISEDLLQDVFLRLFRFANRIDPDRPIEPWIYRITVNLAYTWMKRRQWLQPLEDITEWFAGDTHTPSQQVERQDEWNVIESAVKKLTPAQRTVIVLYYINELSLEEISGILDIPEGTVKSRLHYGRKALRKYLNSGTISGDVQYEFT